VERGEGGGLPTCKRSLISKKKHFHFDLELLGEELACWSRQREQNLLGEKILFAKNYGSAYIAV
jgi:hypothetical protein